MTNTENIQASGSRPSRRTVVKGAAWAVPAIAVASATPAFAASRCLQLSFSGTACKVSNQGQYFIQQICFSNSCQSLSLTIDRVQNNSGKVLYLCDGTTKWTPSTNPITIPGGGGSVCVDVGPVKAASMAGKIEIWGWIGTVSGPATLITDAPARRSRPNALPRSAHDPPQLNHGS
ncbi:hypothetical protein [Raineyella fluvialis]|uniref:hypothetical protein n=1 Tax=Raineyella fluvialis TaxID=2662261 RepID=UPI001E4C79E6|nr:hypothetical protein [Raineyella fluvialis]